MTTYTPNHILTTALAVTAGGTEFISRARANETRQTPSSVATIRALEALQTPDTPAERREEITRRMATYGDATTLAKLRVIIAGLPDTEYGSKIRRLAALDEIPADDHESIGALTSAVVAWANRDDPTRRPPQPGYAAPIGTSLHQSPIRAVVAAVHVFDGNYGTTHLVRFRDHQGHELIWRASQNPRLTPGDNVTLTSGRIKDHTRYRDTDQTVLTHVRLTQH